MNNVY